MKVHHFCLAILFVIAGQVATFGQDNTAEPKEDQVVTVDVEPKVLNLDSVKRQVWFPEKLRDDNVQGNVVTRLLVNEKGRIVKHVVKETPHKYMTEEVEKHIYQLRYAPATKDSKPIMFWTTETFKFKRK